MHQNKRITVKGVRRDPDVKKLSRALIMLAQAQAEKEAELQNKRADQPTRPKAAS